MNMSRNRPRLERSLTLRLWVDRAALVAAVCVLMIGGGLLLTQFSQMERQTCVALYAHARTAADTFAIDNRRAAGRGRSVSCGRLRHDGMLDGHPAPGEARQ